MTRIAEGSVGGGIVGVDVGGTFTDLVLYEPEEQRVRIAKVLSTSSDRTEGIMRALRQAGADPPSLGAIVHGTTVATNAILERRGGHCGLIATSGFRDVLELRRRDRPHTYGLGGAFEPLIPRDLRLEVTERIDAAGQVLTAIEPASMEAAIAALRAAEVEAVAICLFNAHVNPEHERAVAEAVRAALPDVPLSISSEIVPEIGEFERVSTVAANAFVQPLIGRYLGRLEERLREAGFKREVLVLQSGGGVMTSSRARELAVRTVLSGPAAGVVAAMRIGERAGQPNVISCDMGGTSFDVALVSEGKPALATEKAIEFGVPLKVPMIDIHTIGAGGGSIAWIDRGGSLRVGPRSAGSDPGPVAYRRGGEDPTVTDANLVLGRLDPDRNLGTEEDFRLDPDAARAAIERTLARPLELGLEEAAAAVIAVANQRMAAAIRLVSVNRGHDPREFALVVFGGAGPLHAVDLARWVGCRTVVLPPQPGITSALGCVGANLQVDYVRSVGAPLDELDPADVAAALEDQARAGRRFLEEEGVAIERINVSHRAGLAYAKQLHSVGVALDGEPSAWDAARLRNAFLKSYQVSYGVAVRNAAVKLVDLRTTVIGERPNTELHQRPLDDGSTDGGAPAHRDVHLDGQWHATAVYARDELRVGMELTGPAVIEQPDTTSLLPPGAEAQIDHSGNIVIDAKT